MIFRARSWELHIAGAHSLKDKRSVVKSLKDRMRREFNVSVAETAYQDQWQRAEITACLVAADAAQADAVLEKADRMVESNPLVRIVDVQDQRL